MDYIGSLNTAPSPNFAVIVDGSETAIASSVREGTLRDHGLIGPVQLYVTRDVTDQDELFEVICCYATCGRCSGVVLSPSPTILLTADVSCQTQILHSKHLLALYFCCY